MKIYRKLVTKSFRKVPFAEGFPYYEIYLNYIADVVRKYRGQYSILKECGDSIFRDENDPQFQRDYSGVLAYGQVQSGKTAVMVLSIIEAYNLGFKNVFILTGNNNSLHKQTKKRFEDDIKAFNEFLNDAISKDKFNNYKNFQKFNLSQYRNKIIPDMVINTYDLQGKYSISNINEKNALYKDINEKFNKNDGMNLFFSLKNLANYKKIEEIANRSDFIDKTNGILILDDEADWGFEDGESEREAQLFDLLDNLKENVKQSDNYLKYVAFTATPYKIFKNFRQQLVNEDSIVKLRTKEINKEMSAKYVGLNWPYYCGTELFHKSKNQLIFKNQIVKTKKEQELADILNRQFIQIIPNEYNELNLLKLSLILFLLNSYIYNNLNGENFANKNITFGLYFSDWRESEHLKTKKDLINLIQIMDEKLASEVDWDLNKFEDEFLGKNSSTENKIKVLIKEKLKTVNVKLFIDFFKKWISIEKRDIDNFVVKMSGDEEDGKFYSDKKSIDGINAVFVIGGYKLARGVTFDNLVLETITSTSEKEDSTLQRARWFGYRSLNNLKVLDVIMSKDVDANFEKAIQLDDDYRNKLN